MPVKTFRPVTPTRRFQSVVDGLDTPHRAQVLEGVRDIIGPARALVEGDAPARDLMLRSMCGRAR